MIVDDWSQDSLMMERGWWETNQVTWYSLECTQPCISCTSINAYNYNVSVQVAWNHTVHSNGLSTGEVFAVCTHYKGTTTLVLSVSNNYTASVLPRPFVPPSISTFLWCGNQHYWCGHKLHPDHIHQHYNLKFSWEECNGSRMEQVCSVYMY